MFPIRDHNPSMRTPYVTYGLIGLNILIFILTHDQPDQMMRLALYPRLAVAGMDLPAMVTHMFVHAGYMHIAGNLLFLWIFGDNIEDQMGHTGFLAFYLLSGFAAAAAHIASQPLSVVPMVGASGAIAGVMGAYLLMFPRARIDVIAIVIVVIRRFAVAAWVVLGAWLGLQIAMGLMSDSDAGVAYWAHSGGFFAGILLTLPLFLKRGGTRFWQKNHGRPPHPSVRMRQSAIPVVRR